MPRKPTGTPPVDIAPLLSAAEERKLRADAAADLRSVGAYVAWLVAQELERPARTKPLPANTKAKRSPVDIQFALPPKLVRALKKRAQEDMRSLTGDVQVVIIASLVLDSINTIT